MGQDLLHEDLILKMVPTPAKRRIIKLTVSHLCLLNIFSFMLLMLVHIHLCNCLKGLRNLILILHLTEKTKTHARAFPSLSL